MESWFARPWAVVAGSVSAAVLWVVVLPWFKDVSSFELGMSAFGFLCLVFVGLAVVLDPEREFSPVRLLARFRRARSHGSPWEAESGGRE